MSKFETKSCSRCGGSGSFSWNRRDGSTCYGCRGSGVRYTTRGRAAYAFFQSLLKVEAHTIKVGDLVEDIGVTADCTVYTKFRRVVEIWTGRAGDSGAYQVGREDDASIVFTLTDSVRWHVSPDSLVRKGWTKDEKAPLLARAFAYQDTLTQKGEVRNVAHA